MDIANEASFGPSWKTAIDTRPLPGRLREFLHSPRTPHLLKLWDDLRSLPSLPQLDRWLAQRFRSEKRFGQKDRKWYSDALFAVLRLGVWAAAAEKQWRIGVEKSWQDARWLQLHDHRFEPSSWWPLITAMPGDRLFLWLGLRLDHSAVSHPSIHEAGLLKVWEELIQKKSEKDIPLSLLLIWEGIPPFFFAHLHERSEWLPEVAQSFLEKQKLRPPLWLRLKSEGMREEVMAELAAEGFTAKSDGLALAVEGELGVYKLQSYQKGFIEIQDRASQRIGEAVPLERGSRVWDCCAGGGGKSVQLASRLENSGAVYASDVRSYKLTDLRERAGRAQLANIRYWTWDGEGLPALGKELEKRKGFDAVLIDAPCSGAGTWRRNPDAKLRVSETSLQELTAIQDKILKTVSAAVREGGSLVYATCSWLRVENEERVTAFLAGHSEFELVDQQLLGCPMEDADTMFVAVMRRKPKGNE